MISTKETLSKEQVRQYHQQAPLLQSCGHSCSSHAAALSQRCCCSICMQQDAARGLLAYSSLRLAAACSSGQGRQAAVGFRLLQTSRQGADCILLHAELLQKLSYDRAAAWGLQLRPQSSTAAERPR